MASVKKITVIGVNSLHMTVERLMNEYNKVQVLYLGNQVYEVKAWGRKDKAIRITL